MLQPLIDFFPFGRIYGRYPFITQFVEYFLNLGKAEIPPPEPPLGNSLHRVRRTGVAGKVIQKLLFQCFTSAIVCILVVYDGIRAVGVFLGVYLAKPVPGWQGPFISGIGAMGGSEVG